jgi:hypothetical protein
MLLCNSVDVKHGQWRWCILFKAKIGENWLKLDFLSSPKLRLNHLPAARLLHCYLTLIKGAKEDRNNMKGRSKNLYTTAHLFVSAIRVWEYQNDTPPAIEEISHMLAMSIERGNYICRKLQEIGIIESVEGSFGNRLFIRDHLKIEEIPREDDESKLEEELKKFQESQKGLSQKIKTIQAKQAQKKKDLFAEMEKKLKQELDKKS